MSLDREVVMQAKLIVACKAGVVGFAVALAITFPAAAAAPQTLSVTTSAAKAGPKDLKLAWCRFAKNAGNCNYVICRPDRPAPGTGRDRQ